MNWPWLDVVVIELNVGLGGVGGAAPGIVVAEVPKLIPAELCE